jgi:hypothetical protein
MWESDKTPALERNWMGNRVCKNTIDPSFPICDVQQNEISCRNAAVGLNAITTIGYLVCTIYILTCLTILLTKKKNNYQVPRITQCLCLTCCTRIQIITSFFFDPPVRILRSLLLILLPNSDLATAPVEVFISLIYPLGLSFGLCAYTFMGYLWYQAHQFNFDIIFLRLQLYHRVIVQGQLGSTKEQNNKWKIRYGIINGIAFGILVITFCIDVPRNNFTISVRSQFKTEISN